MARHLLDSNPELFVGFPGCDTPNQVESQRERILYYTYHSARCHDLGKLFIVDVVSMHASTRDYVDVIKGHHIWYDCSRGYPTDFDTFKSPYKTIIDIVLAADCLDAATDTVGRSYNKGKTLDDYEKEIAEGAGTHYAPFLTDLLARPEVREDIVYLLGEGRSRMYRELYMLL